MRNRMRGGRRGTWGKSSSVPTHSEESRQQHTIPLFHPPLPFFPGIIIYRHLISTPSENRLKQIIIHTKNFKKRQESSALLWASHFWPTLHFDSRKDYSLLSFFPKRIENPCLPSLSISRFLFFCNNWISLSAFDSWRSCWVSIGQKLFNQISNDDDWEMDWDEMRGEDEKNFKRVEKKEHHHHMASHDVSLHLLPRIYGWILYCCLLMSLMLCIFISCESKKRRYRQHLRRNFQMMGLWSAGIPTLLFMTHSQVDAVNNTFRNPKNLHLSFPIGLASDDVSLIMIHQKFASWLMTHLPTPRMMGDVTVSIREIVRQSFTVWKAQFQATHDKRLLLNDDILKSHQNTWWLTSDENMKKTG